MNGSLELEDVSTETLSWRTYSKNTLQSLHIYWVLQPSWPCFFHNNIYSASWIKEKQAGLSGSKCHSFSIMGYEFTLLTHITYFSVYALFSDAISRQKEDMSLRNMNRDLSPTLSKVTEWPKAWKFWRLYILTIWFHPRKQTMLEREKNHTDLLESP